MQLALHPQAVGIHDLIAAFLSGRSATTIRAYRSDLLDFARFQGLADIDEVAAALFRDGHGPANLAAIQYRAHLLAAKLAPATINRRLAALRSLVALARTLGVVVWTLEVEGVAGQAHRDTRGPGMAGLRALMRTASDQRPEKAVRDRAIILMLFALALRRAEVVSLDYDHWDPTTGTVQVLGKGCGDRVTMTVPAPVAAALAEWLTVRGNHPGPLFTNCDRAQKGCGRLTGDGLYRLVRSLGRQAGIVVRPHGLRHTAITAALDLTAGDVRSVARYSRHAKVETTLIYDDQRKDTAGLIAKQVVDLASAPG